MAMYQTAINLNHTHGPKFTTKQRELIIQGYEDMKTLPVILTEFRQRFPNRGVFVTENSLRSCIDRARKAGLIKREKFARNAPMNVKYYCIELYNEGKSQRDIIAGIHDKFNGLQRDITRNVISGWVKWGKDHGLLTRKQKPHVVTRYHRGQIKHVDEDEEFEPGSKDFWCAPVTLPYVKIVDPARAEHVAKLLGMPVELYKLRLMRR